MHESNHPIWSLARFGLAVVAVTVVLSINASDFDETEIKTITEIAILVGGYEGAAAFFNRKKPKED